MVASSVVQPFESELDETSLSAPAYCGITSIDGFISPYPDISSIGIILCFIIIGATILILAAIRLLGCYWKDFGTRDLLGGEPLTLLEGKTRPNLEDATAYVEEIRWQANIQCQQSALNETIYNLGDTLLATGVALLVVTLSKRGITMYHCLLCDEMVWLSFLGAEVGHVGLLSGIPHFFRNLARIILLSILLCLITYMETIINIDADLADHVYKFKPLALPDPISVFMLVWAWISVAVMIVELYPPAWVLMDYYVEMHMIQIIPPSPIPGLLPSRFNFQSPSWIFVLLWYNLGVFGRLAFFTVVVLVWIPAWTITVIIFWLFFNPIMSALASLGFYIWGLYEIIHLREIGRSCMRPEMGSEDQFEFGQAVVLTLFILCVVNSGDLWIGNHCALVTAFIKLIWFI